MQKLIEFLAWLFGAIPDPTPAPPPPPGPTNAILVEINRVRAQHGKQPFIQSACLDNQAVAWAAEMQRRGRMSHSGFAGRLSACSMQGGEIVAWGQRTVQEVVDDWMHSRGHRARILSNSTHFGGGSAGVYWCGLDGTPSMTGVDYSHDEMLSLKPSEQRHGAVA